MRPRLSLIVAASENDVIGRDGDLPWHLPKDLRRFKRLTTGHPIIMGRKTHESIGRPLPNRRSIVLSRDPEYRADGVEVAPSLDKALALAKSGEPADEIFVIGGYEVFRRAMPRADRLYLTRVHAEVDGDVLFPDFDPERWTLVEDVRHESDAKHAHAFSFQTYDRTAHE